MDVREFFGAIWWLLRPSLPWCVRLAGPTILAAQKL